MPTNYNSGLKTECIISEEVIAAIAVNAAKDVAGVAGLGNCPVDLMTAFKPTTNELRHCKVSSSDFDIKVHLYLTLAPNAKIQDVSSEVQKAVKKTIQNITGRLVTRVDITITGIDKEAEEPEADLAFEVKEP